MPGRMYADTASRALVTADAVVGVGFGTSGVGTVAFTAGSTDQRGEFTVTTGATSLAQATATLAITFAQAWEVVPVAVAATAVGTGAGTIKWNVNSITATVVTFILDTIPVTLLTYKCQYFICG